MRKCRSISLRKGARTLCPLDGWSVGGAEERETGSLPVLFRSTQAGSAGSLFHSRISGKRFGVKDEIRGSDLLPTIFYQPCESGERVELSDGRSVRQAACTASLFHEVEKQGVALWKRRWRRLETAFPWDAGRETGSLPVSSDPHRLAACFTGWRNKEWRFGSAVGGGWKPPFLGMLGF
jgi:hypothetical protein